MTAYVAGIATVGGGLAILQAIQGGKIDPKFPDCSGLWKEASERIKQETEKAAQEDSTVEVDHFESRSEFTWHTAYKYSGFFRSGVSTARLGEGWHISAKLDLKITAKWTRITVKSDVGSSAGASAKEIWMNSGLMIRSGDNRLPARNEVKLDVAAQSAHDGVTLTFNWTENGLWKSFTASAQLFISNEPQKYGVGSCEDFKKALAGEWDRLSADLVKLGEPGGAWKAPEPSGSNESTRLVFNTSDSTVVDPEDLSDSEAEGSGEEAV
jgi:hypothetical protein